MELGNFRTKSKTENPPEPVVVEEPKKPKEVKEVKMWARKERNEDKKDEVDSPTKLRYKEKKSEEGENAKKKNYVEVDPSTDPTPQVKRQGMLEEDD